MPRKRDRPETDEERKARGRVNSLRHYHRYPERRRLSHQKMRYGFTPPPELSHCEACGTPFTQFKKGACVDHDHAAGKFRGWLCSPCNTALGHAKDSRDRLQLLINYLDRAELLA